MKIVGLTGGIGCGKSTFCRLMGERGVASVDADLIARQVVEPGSVGLKQIVENFGKDLLNPDNSLDRKALRERIFADPNEQSDRERLEAILHPLIQDETERQIARYRHDPKYQQPILLVAIPLLIEGILKRGTKPDYLDEIWVLDCQEETQIARASHRDDVSVEQIKNILASQASRQQRRLYADKLINNDGNLSQLEEQVQQLLNP